MKFYYCFMSNALYYMGHAVSRPMSWGWFDADNWIDSKTASINYSIYNWLMLKSVDFNDKSDCDVWTRTKTDEIDENNL